MIKENKKPNVPNLRFPEFKEKWKKTSILLLGTMGRGKSKHRPRDDVKLFGGEYPFIQTGDIRKSNLYIRSFEQTYSEFGLQQSKLWKKGTLCITIAANIAETSILDFDACFPDSVIGWNSNSSTTNLFIKYYFDYYKTSLKRISVGGMQENLNLNKLQQLFFNIPSYTEQYKISILLSTIDTRIETQIKIIEDLYSIKNYSLTKELEKIDTYSVISLASVINDYSRKTLSNNEYPVLSSTANGVFLQSDYFNKETSSKDTTGYNVVPKGYCTYRSMSDTGDFNFNIQSVVDYGIVSPAYPVFYSDQMSLDYIVLYLNNSKRIKKQIIQFKTGGTRFAFSFKSLSQLTIPNIPLQLQDQIINRIQRIDLKIKCENEILNNLYLQKQYLLNNLFI